MPMTYEVIDAFAAIDKVTSAKEVLDIMGACFVKLSRLPMTKAEAEALCTKLEEAAERMRRGIREGDFRGGN